MPILILIRFLLIANGFIKSEAYIPTVNSLIFGISGQDGFYLKELCLQEELEVIGVSRSEGDWIRGDVSDLKLVEGLIRA